MKINQYQPNRVQDPQTPQVNTGLTIPENVATSGVKPLLDLAAKAAGAGVDIAAKKLDEQRKIVAEDAANALREHVNARQAAASQVRGKDVMNNAYGTKRRLLDVEKEKFNKAYNDQIAALSHDPVAKEYFTRHADDLYAGFENNLTNHEYTETQRYNDVVMGNKVKTLTDAAMADPGVTSAPGWWDAYKDAANWPEKQLGLFGEELQGGKTAAAATAENIVKLFASHRRYAEGLAWLDKNKAHVPDGAVAQLTFGLQELKGKADAAQAGVDAATTVIRSATAPGAAVREGVLNGLRLVETGGGTLKTAPGKDAQGDFGMQFDAFSDFATANPSLVPSYPATGTKEERNAYRVRWLADSDNARASAGWLLDRNAKQFGGSYLAAAAAHYVGAGNLTKALAKFGYAPVNAAAGVFDVRVQDELTRTVQAAGTNMDFGRYMQKVEATAKKDAAVYNTQEPTAELGAAVKQQTLARMRANNASKDEMHLYASNFDAAIRQQQEAFKEHQSGLVNQADQFIRLGQEIPANLRAQLTPDSINTLNSRAKALKEGYPSPGNESLYFNLSHNPQYLIRMSKGMLDSLDLSPKQREQLDQIRSNPKTFEFDPLPGALDAFAQRKFGKPYGVLSESQKRQVKAEPYLSKASEVVHNLVIRHMIRNNQESVDAATVSRYSKLVTEATYRKDTPPTWLTSGNTFPVRLIEATIDDVPEPVKQQARAAGYASDAQILSYFIDSNLKHL